MKILPKKRGSGKEIGTEIGRVCVCVGGGGAKSKRKKITQNCLESTWEKTKDIFLY